MKDSPKTRRYEIEIDEATGQRLDEACTALKSLHANLLFQPRSLIAALVEITETDDLIDRIIVLEDRRLRSQRDSLKSLRTIRKKGQA